MPSPDADTRKAARGRPFRIGPDRSGTSIVATKATVGDPRRVQFDAGLATARMGAECGRPHSVADPISTAGDAWGFPPYRRLCSIARAAGARDPRPAFAAASSSPNAFMSRPAARASLKSSRSSSLTWCFTYSLSTFTFAS